LRFCHFQLEFQWFCSMFVFEVPVKEFFKLLLLFAFALSNADQIVSAQESDEVLTNASAVLALSGDQASRDIKVSIRGIVTAAEPDWGGRFFIQDSSGGVFVENISSRQPAPGDVLTLSGISFPGGYAPTISRPDWTKVGEAPLPHPKPVAIEDLMSGTEDGQRVKFSGIVRQAQRSGRLLETELTSGGYRVVVYSPMLSDIDPENLIGARVDVAGTPATTFNGTLRHLVSVDVYSPVVTDFSIVKLADSDPFQEPLTPINNIAQYRAGRTLADRVHIKGVLTYQRNGEDLFIKDATGGLQIKSREVLSLSKGDVVEAVGFSEFENFLPVLNDAIFRKAPEPPADVEVVNPPVGELLEGLHHSDFITVQGKLLDHLEKRSTSPTGEPDIMTILELQSSNVVFTAEAETSVPNQPLISIPIGSLVEVSGICFLQSAADGRIQSVQILIPAADNVRVLKKPSWLTPERLFISLVIAFIVIIAGTTWAIMVTRRNSALKGLIHERELDQKELQKAHDTLESRVKERTEQLKFQVTARKEAEVQFKATLTERTRLARELHDTIEQTMTGITLQLNTINKLFELDPKTATHHLGLIRSMVRRSRVDLRRTIWDLRSREQEQFDLCKALSIGANRITEDAGIRIEIETRGNVRPLPEVVEDTLLRISQEAITNTVKHSGARHIKIELDFSDQNIVLKIKDNGNGFTPENCAGPNEGHFGILGMAERAKRVDGQISITSQPGQGTVVRVELPITSTNLSQTINEPADQPEIIADSNSYS
ncbi:MAG TPA: histidine kinase, partial [Candidatus Acidoferrum sp.]|nr:histidine kinase [Candidatus Acidoferrum sp.]